MRKINVRCIVQGRARGDVVYSSEPISFLRGVDPQLGIVTELAHEIYNKPFTGRILVFPYSSGSSVGSYTIYKLKKNQKAPKAIINQSADIITASGCAIADIPLFDLPRNCLSELKYAERISLDGEECLLDSA